MILESGTEVIYYKQASCCSITQAEEYIYTFALFGAIIILPMTALRVKCYHNDVQVAEKTIF